MIRVAYGIRPHLGGTWSVFETLRPALAAEGVDLRWVAVGPSANRPDCGAECGEWIEVADPSRPQAGEALVAHLCASYNAVIANILAERWFLAALRHLPPRPAVIGLVHSTSHGTYRAARAVAPWLDALVCPSRRMEEDLRSLLRGFAGAWHRVPHGVADEFLRVPRDAPADGARLRLLFAGRLEDASKRVLLLPAVLQRLADLGIAHTLTIAGDGPDRARLEELLPPGAARFLGRVPRAEMPALLARHDILLMPSRWEGFPMGLLEAMAAGCVPVCALLKGVTDDLVDQGVEGLLPAEGSPAAYAEAVAELADRKRLAAMSQACRVRAARYTAARQAVWLAAAIRAAAADRRRRGPLPLRDWALPPGLADHPVTGLLPQAAKDLLRAWRERMRRG